MSSLPILDSGLRLPAIGAPMFTVSNPAMVLAQCSAGLVGAFPAANARAPTELDDWLVQLEEGLAAEQARSGGRLPPFAVNQIVNPGNTRLEADLRICVQHRVPVTITSMRAPNEVIQEIHAYGGVVLHDVVNVRHAMKALQAGVDGLILVAQGAGGYAGRINPIALVAEVRREYDGPLVLAGAITTGAGILAARAMGADYAYLGSRFIASREASAPDEYKQALVAGSAADVVYTDFFTGVHANYLRSSIVAAGLDPENLHRAEGTAFSLEGRKAWKNIYGAGQGIGSIDAVLEVSAIVERLEREYRAAMAGIRALP
jgi:nitronate monooxygenase